MDFIKAWFIDAKNKTGCRFIIVDSYNEERPINYYKRNGFIQLFGTEDQERMATQIPENKSLKTRLLDFDFIILSAN